MDNPFTGKFATYFDNMDEREQWALCEHLRIRTSAQWIADTLTKHGLPISPTTIKEQRKRYLNSVTE